MTSNVYLQIFLYLQVFVIGVLATLAFRHGREHYRPAAPHQPEPEHAQEIQPQSIELPEGLKNRLLLASQAQFETAVKNSAALLQQNLATTNEQINGLIMKLATDVVNSELQNYRADLDSLRKRAETDMGSIRATVEGHEAELKAQLAQEIAAEKQRLIKQIDTKLADAVGSFLVETLGHSVDLGSQSTYLVQMLEEHKADFLKEVGDGPQPAK